MKVECEMKLELKQVCLDRRSYYIERKGKKCRGEGIGGTRTSRFKMCLKKVLTPFHFFE